MDIDDSPEEAAYRQTVRAYLEEHSHELHTGRGRAEVDDVEAHKHNQRVLYEGGLVGIQWPKEYGGQGGTPMQQVIANQEIARAEVPGLIGLIGVGMCGPTIIGHGTEEHKARFLPPLLRGEEIWAQLFSEPGSGSDLAALSTRAVRDNGSWRINGQKVWTSGAQYSDYGIIITRTDPSLPKHRGLTMFIIDLHHPGVTVRPLKQMSGDAGFNEVFLDDVEVPDDWRLGDVNDGWRVAITTLMNERMAIGGGGTDLGGSVESLVETVAERIESLSPDRAAVARQELAECWIESLACRYTGYRRLTALSKGQLPGPEGSAGKLAGTAVARRIADLGVRMQLDDAVFQQSGAGDARWQNVQASLPGIAIAGGTNEVLKNILGERVLGLPPEPRLDKDKPAAEILGRKGA
ncbi:MAG TPA: acyl-CoA dehydrogenase family protein [Mycobacteriales bacterium]|jgi:alkylation response protein AidB-like acyl-CoA dehydrogenase|nr:acyl-CoA dehydrogenase family protein [Mycobacteriales bacterium]